MPVAEMFLSAVTQVLIDRLVSLLLLEFATRQGIRSHLEKLKANLKMITTVITHAENMLLRETEVDEWLEEFRDWAYDADDFLDEVNTRAAMQEEEEEEARGNPESTLGKSKWPGQDGIFGKVRDFAFGFIYGTQYSKGVDELKNRLDTICERMDEMRRLLKMTSPTDNTSTPPLKFMEATAHAFDARVFGREQEKETIIEQLKSSRDIAVEVISIVGMPGIGKTTLARHVFNSVKKQEQEQEPPLLFDIKGWVCVSDDFDVNRITKDILESFTCGTYDLSRLEQFQSTLKEVVGGKRFLLVLDDVWTSNYLDWDALRSPFGVGAPGSKILVTTRDNKVASMMQTNDPMKIHHLGTLCDDDCWWVFLQHVIDGRNADFESEAGCFRMKILDRCKGLPLTAKLLAGILRGQSPGQGWEAKLKSSIWDLSENELAGRKGVCMLPVVMLSYFHLPANLKRCFSYCSVLPEDYEFEEEEIVLMWMAQGLVLLDRVEQVEVTGSAYFRELVSRSLFQPSPNYPSRFIMHDLINDMAEMVAGKSCLMFDGNLKMDSIPAQARYLSFRNITLKMEFEAFESTKYLREFHSFHRTWENYLTRYVTLELLMKLKYLRVLCLRGYFVSELPEDMGNLTHLRLVDLSDTDIRRLPQSTSSLYNLQTLKLKGCVRLRALPSQMWKLINLRNLDCSSPNELVAMPIKMGKLTSLQKLSNFIVGQGLEQGVGQLKYLSHLKESISISSLENVHDSKEAKEAKLMSKEGLRSLELKWNSDRGDLQGTRASFHVFEELQPHKHLEELIVTGYGGFSFPGWVGDGRFSKMRVIKLADCGKCTSLPPLGKLPVLEEIQIGNMSGIECVGEEFYGKERGAFPTLKVLQFLSMENWSTWLYPAGGGCSFACLQELHVINCPKLSMSLPDCIKVHKLVVKKCDELLVALPRQSILDMDIGECKVQLMGCLNEDEDASQLLPSVITSLRVEKVDVVEGVGSASMITNIISHEDVVGAHHPMMMLGSLTALEMAGIPKLTHLPGVVLQGLPKLEQLRICRCEELTSLWKKQKSHFFNSLRVLEVLECCQLVCLVVPERGEEELDDTDRDTGISEEKEEEKREKQQCLDLPSGLETLRLSRCAKLEKLPSDLHNLASLRKLEIYRCRRLSCLPEMGFPSTLELLSISGCNGNGMPLPHSLKRMDISDCENLESVVVGSTAFTSADSSPSLQSVHIFDCPKLKSLPEGLIHRRLKTLCIKGCQNLGDLSISSVPHHLTALESLSISGWPAGLLSIQQGQGVPNPNSLPPNLRDLSIECSNDGQLFSVPLPPSLTDLWISNFKKLSPEAFQNLTSLQGLYILSCPGLTSIPDQLRLPSLRSFEISDCPGLTSIPDQLLPPSLRSLHIEGCPLLAHEFAKGKGRYWPKLKFIPQVHIDCHSIFD